MSWESLGSSRNSSLIFSLDGVSVQVAVLIVEVVFLLKPKSDFVCLTANLFYSE